MLQPRRGQQLHADADAEERPRPAVHGLVQRIDQAGNGVEAALAVGESADARQHDAVGPAHDLGVGGEHDVRAGATLARGALQGLDRGMEVARTVIDDGNAHAVVSAGLWRA